MQGWDYYLYSLWVLYYEFIEFSPMIRVCSILLSACIVTYVITSIIMTYNNYVNAFKERRVRKMQERYGKIIDNILLSQEELEALEIRERLGLSQNNKRFKDKEREAIIQMMAEKVEHYGINNINRNNYSLLLETFQLVEWIEHSIEKGSIKDKINAFRLVQILDFKVRSSQSVQYVYDRNTDLKKAARFAYIYSAQSAAFRFFEEDPNFRYFKSDGPSLHYILDYRQRNKMSMPDYINWMKIPQSNNWLKLFSIKEIELFNKREDAKRLFEYYKNSEDAEVRGMILRTLGKMKYTEMEEEIMQKYLEEGEFVRRCTIVALLELGTGNPKVVDFIRSQFDDVRDINTRMTMLNALYNYNEYGRNTFAQLENAAKEKDKMQFLHIKNPLTNDRAYEL